MPALRRAGHAHCGGCRRDGDRPCRASAARSGVARRVLQQARMPRRYEHCTLDSFEPSYGGSGSNRSLVRGLMAARKFVESYPMETDGTGLLLTGSIGVGKTHLAVGILQSLIAERGASGLFYDYRELLKQVQNSYNPRVAATELEILGAGLRCGGAGAGRDRRLQADGLGVGHGRAYSEYPLQRPSNDHHHHELRQPAATRHGRRQRVRAGQARTAMRDETLGDRIGERMRSRLQEMCVVVEMQGEDFRQKVKRASFCLRLSR